MKKLLFLLLLLCNAAAAQNIMQFTGGNYVFAEQDKLTFNLRHDIFLNRRWVYDAATDSAVAEFVVSLPVKTAHSSTWHGYTADGGEYVPYGTMYARFNGMEGFEHGRYGQEAYQGGLQRTAFGDYSVNFQTAEMGGAFVQSHFIRDGGIIRQGGNSQLSKLAISCAPNIPCHSSIRADLDFAQNLHHTVISRKRHLATNPRFVPALLWGARVVGFVGRMVLPGAVTACMRNLKCTAGVVGTTIGLAPPCAINMVSGVLTNVGVFPIGVCQKIEQAGFTKGDDGEYIRTTGYVVSGDGSGETYSAISVEHGKQLFRSHFCESLIGKRFSNEDQIYTAVTDFRITESANPGNYHVGCTLSVSNHGYVGVSGSIQQETRTEKLTMIDLEQFVGEDFKDNPTPYMNDKGEVGEALRGAIRLRKADLNHSGNGVLTLTSAPYRNSQGQTVQDRVTIGRPQTETRPNPSGNVSQPAPGISNTYNTVNIQNIERPDKEAESLPGENNSPNNGANVSGSSGNPSSGEQGGNHCRDNPQSVGCMGIGDVDGNANPFNIPTADSGIGYRPDSFLPENGVCPAPKQVQILGFTYEFSYYWLCEFAAMIRAVFIVLAGVVAARIVFKS